MFEDENELPNVRSKPHKIKHQMFGIFVCTGMAHLVLTTFEVPDISYVRIFLVGAFYVTLSLSVKLGHERAVYLSIAAAMFSTFSSLIEYLLLGGNVIASGLIMFDAFTIYLVWKYQQVKDLPLPEGLHEDDQGLRYQRRKRLKEAEISDKVGQTA